jgi:formate dehydrogenase alpha subunit
MAALNLEIDGRRLTAQPGATILEVARSAGIEIPTLCHHPDLAPIGSCRLCLVEELRMGKTAAACKLPAVSGMVVRTASPALDADRRFTLKMLLASYVHDPATGAEANELLHWARRYGVEPDFVPSPRYAYDSDPSPVIRVNLNQCIQCLRCVRACNEVQGRFVWHLADRGHDTHITPGLGGTMHDARCESCGACAAYCPTGALADRHSLGNEPPDRLVTTTCAYCGVGCQFDLNVRHDRVVRVTSNPAAPVNGMSLCVKGRYGFEYLNHPDRLLRPRVRQAHLADDATQVSPQDAKASPWVDVDWSTALDLVARRLARIRRESGPDAIGLLASAKCTNEENYLMQKFARQVIGTNNIDHCARLCHSSTVAGLAMSFGSGAMSNSMDDVAEHAAAMFVIGSNTTEQHPVFGTMIRQAVQRRGMPLVVADPRRIDLVEFAALHLRQRPGTDVALVNGLAHLILAHGWHHPAFIAARCEGFDDYAVSLARYTPPFVADITGVPVGDLHRAAEILGTQHPLAVVWAMGITQHTTGVINVLALANLQMLLGNMGVPGGGVNPLRGQNNVQGACDMGALPNVLPGYQGVASSDAAQKFHDAWALAGTVGAPPPASFGAIPGLTVTEMIEAGGRGMLRGLYILGEDPAMTEPDSNRARESLAATEFVVLQEILSSETADYADVLLPGAAFAEKSGTFTNTERRVQLVRQATNPPGEARPDWEITTELAGRLLAELSLAPAGPQAAWDYASPAAILREAATLTPSYAGISHERLARGERLQWPVPTASHPGTPILHVRQFTRGLGKFHVVEHLPPHELPDEAYPLVLTTGRVLYHWHGGELSRRSPMLLAECPEPRVEIHPDDARRHRLTSGQWVRVNSRRGQLRAVADVTVRVAPGLVFGNFHFPGSGNVNNLTIQALDPVAKIPEYKVCAVRLEPDNS